MRAPTSLAGHLGRLYSWDAPFLPSIDEIAVTSEGIELHCEAPGVDLPQANRWPRGQRAAVALQVVAAAAFLFERGWYPSRTLLRGARVTRGEDGVWLRLPHPPCRRLEDAALERRLRAVLGTEDNLLRPVVTPLLRALLPERALDLERAAAARPVWEAAPAWVEVLLTEGHGGGAVRHPAGRGRALWARRFLLPQRGVAWVEEDELLPRLTVAAHLLTLDGSVIVAGALEEADVVRAQARAAADGRDCLVLTTLSLPGVEALPLAAEADAAWVLGADIRQAHAHLAAVVAASGQHPRRAGQLLRAGGHSGFAGPPVAPAARERGALASPQARRAVGWLERVPVGLETEDLLALAEVPGETVAELERLGLAQRRRGVWHPASCRRDCDPGDLKAVAGRLPKGSRARMVAEALIGKGWDTAAGWCEARLGAGAVDGVFEVGAALARFPPLRLAAVEAALATGRLREAERLIEGAPEGEREARWHALAAWWAEQAGITERAVAEVAAGGTGLPGRLVARRELVAAELARRDGKRDAQLEHLERAVAACEPPLVDALLARAARDGPEALRGLRRARGSAWENDQAARLLHLLGVAALYRDSYPAGATALRAALRAASGDNLRLVGEIHADLGCAAILADNIALADRHLLLAENLLERCGSRRSVTLVRANRALLAGDRLDWRTCRDLNLAVRRERGDLGDGPTLLVELELARAELARGDVQVVAGLLPAFEAVLRERAGDLVATQTLASLGAHVALAGGDLERAFACAQRAEPGEKALILSLGVAARGVDPHASLPQRWGVLVTAQLLAAWQRGDEAEALHRTEREIERSPLEASVGLARFVAILARRGQHPSAAWIEVERRAEECLLSAELEGWAGILRGACGLDPVRLLRGLDGILNAGTDALNEARLAAFAHALGLRRLEIIRDGVRIGGWGDGKGEVSEFKAGAMLVRAAGAGPPAAEEALRLLVRHLATRHGASGSTVEAAAGELLGTSAALRGVREQVARWGPLPLTVLVTGEPGTGKELVARELHRCSKRSGPFVPVNCAGIPATLLEAELFGVARGAFTGADRDRAGLVEAAEGGTLFLDEVGELPLELQGKLLRLLQGREVRRVGATRSRTVDVRFVAATNRDLGAAVAAGAFRPDLYYRLAVAVVTVPPLRERPEDVEVLARLFAERFAATLDRPGVRLAPAAIEVLRRGAWPGNARELESAIARAMADARPGEVLGPDRFPGIAPGAVASAPRPAWPDALAQFRRSYFTAILEECGGNRTRAARRAGVSRQTLLYHLRELGLRNDDDA